MCVNPDCNPWKVLGTHAHASAAEVKAEESSAFFGHESNRLDKALLTAVDPEVPKAALRHSSGKPLLCILTKGAQKRREM